MSFLKWASARSLVSSINVPLHSHCDSIPGGEARLSLRSGCMSRLAPISLGMTTWVELALPAIAALNTSGEMRAVPPSNRPVDI